jgi:manganese/iron transport system ATP-binding protein
VFGGTPADARGKCGYVPQVDDLDADFPVTAGQVVMMGRYRRIGWWRPIKDVDRQAVRDALERVGLGGHAGQRFGLLSGGQRQRVLLARAIAGEPAMLLLDEPFNGVDVVSQEAILAVLRELTAAGTALVLSTHDLVLARDFADLVCLVNGRQWAAGPPGVALTAERLRLAYGGHAVELADGHTVLVEP